MNELEFLRTQIRLERQHMVEVRKNLEVALARPVPQMQRDAIERFCTAAARYLVFIVKRFNAQDQIHCQQLRPNIAGGDHDNEDALAALECLLARSRVAIASLQAALPGPGAADAQTSGMALRHACAEYLQFYRDEMLQRNSTLTALFERHYGTTEWRSASLLDADAVLQERQLYAAVQAAAISA